MGDPPIPVAQAIFMDETVQISDQLRIENTNDLLAHSLALELEASERYAELAEQMQTHNNLEVAELFLELSRIEKLHVERVLEQAALRNVKDISASKYQWEYPEGPETTNLEEAHYLMTPHHALQLALHNEKRAGDFFTRIAAAATDGDVAHLATEMAAEEQEHVSLIEEWLTRYPEPDDDWSDDPDPPVGRD
jgi:rubrerythrin